MASFLVFLLRSEQASPRPQEVPPFSQGQHPGRGSWSGAEAAHACRDGRPVTKVMAASLSESATGP